MRFPPADVMKTSLTLPPLDGEPVDRKVVDQLVTQDTTNNISERPKPFGFNSLDFQRPRLSCLGISGLQLPLGQPKVWSGDWSQPGW